MNNIEYPNEWPVHNWDFAAGLGNSLQKSFEEKLEALEDEQLKHREAPTDEEINEMYALAGSDSQNYRDAH